MRLFKIILSLMALLIWSAGVRGDYNPANPPEPGVYFTLSTGCIPAEAGYGYTSSGAYAFGTTIWMNVYANTGFRFVQWEDADGNVVSTERSFNYLMPPQNVSLRARFVYDPANPDEPPVPEIKRYSTVFTQVVPSDAGYINQNSGETFEVGSVVRYRATAYSNYVFKNWSIDGEVISESRELDYTIPKEDHTLVATFTYSPSNPEEPGTPHPHRVLTLISNMEGAGSLSGGGSYPDGTSVRVQASVNRYYTFESWTDEAGDTISLTRSFDYTMPTRNVTLTANYSYYYNPDSPGEPNVPSPPGSVGENMVAFPRFGMWDDAHVMILCETPGATIYYTLDGTDPDETSAVYESPVYVERNLLVKAIAKKEGMEDSPIRSFQVTAYHAAAPIFRFVKRKVQISSDTPGATIRYTTDFSDPTVESEVYTTPLEPEENSHIKAYASKEGLTDSNISIYVYRRADNTLAPPTFKHDESGKLEIVAAMDGGVTHYTLDGTDPDETSSVYTDPLELSEYTVVRAYTTHEDYFDSAIAEYTEDVVSKENPAVLTENFIEREMLIEHPDSRKVRIIVDGNEAMEVATPYRLTITPEMKKVIVVAIASDIHHQDSDPVEKEIVVLAPPAFGYNGHTLYLTAGDAATASTSFSTHIDFNDISEEVTNEASYDVSGFGIAEAYNWSETAYRSDPAVVVIDFFNTGIVAGARNGHHLSEAFGTWEENSASGTYLQNYEYLRVLGELEAEDLRFLSSLPVLTTLHIETDNLPQSADYIFSGSRIETICSGRFPEGMLKGMTRLATLIWGKDDSQMPDGILSEAGNPNLLLWISDRNNAPTDAVNVVVYGDTASGYCSDPDNTEVKGWAERIILEPGYPFSAYHPVEVGDVEFIKEFTMPTEINECQGWESIVLPFMPSSITRIANGETLLPYPAWSMTMVDNNNYYGPKPFWLYKATTADWVAAEAIEARVPYIISMPNNPYYVDEFNISDFVSFAASNVVITKEDCTPAGTDWKNGMAFKGSFMPVEESHLALNGMADGDDLRPGSAFVSDVVAKPFEGYVAGYVADQGDRFNRKSIPVFGNLSGLTLPSINDGGLIILPEGKGGILIMSDRSIAVDVYTATGIKVRSVDAPAGESVVVDHLSKGIYIVAGRKVMVR